MADTVTQTDELQIELLNDSGDARRVIRIIDPADELTRAAVEAALAPAFAYDGPPSPDSGTTRTAMPFFYDDNDASVGLTRVGTIERVRTMKTVTTIE